MRLIVAVLAACFVLAAGKPADPSFRLSHEQTDTYVEQQSPAVFDHPSPERWLDFCPEECVKNTTGCAWDIDDGSQWAASGTLPAGATITQSGCSIADGAFNWGHPEEAGFMVFGKTADLSVNMTSSLGHVWTAEPTPNGRGYRWDACARYKPAGPFPEIPDTNGGWGYRVDYTITVTAGDRPVRDFLAVFEVADRAGVWTLC